MGVLGTSCVFLVLYSDAECLEHEWGKQGASRQRSQESTFTPRAELYSGFWHTNTKNATRRQEQMTRQFRCVTGGLVPTTIRSVNRRHDRSNSSYNLLHL